MCTVPSHLLCINLTHLLLSVLLPLPLRSHRYSCSDLSDADSGSNAGDELDAVDDTSSQQQQQRPRLNKKSEAAAAGQQQGSDSDADTAVVADADAAADEHDGDLDAIHSLGQSLEEDVLRQQLRISSQLQLLQKQQLAESSSSPRLSPRVALALRAAQAAAGSRVGGVARRSSGGALMPVQEEEHAGEVQVGGWRCAVLEFRRASAYL
jgi:hypothetical protein